MTWLVLTVAAGAMFGSFVASVGWRLRNRGSLLAFRSVCDHCRSPIRWRDSIPVLGWLLLRGRARCCDKPIPRTYPIVEAATTLVWVWWLEVFGAVWWLAVVLPVSAVVVAVLVPDAARWWQRIRRLDWRAAVVASSAAFLVRWGLFLGVLAAATEAGLGYHLTVNQAWATVVGFGVVAFAAAAGVWWLIYRRLARPGRLWARAQEQRCT